MNVDLQDRPTDKMFTGHFRIEHNNKWPCTSDFSDEQTQQTTLLSARRSHLREEPISIITPHSFIFMKRSRPTDSTVGCRWFLFIHL